MKICVTCKQQKELSEFTKNQSKSDGKNHSCKICQRKYNKAHYEANKSMYIDKAHALRQEATEWLAAYKAANPCSDCGKIYPSVCMDFDHVSGTKIENVSKLPSYGFKKLKEEMAKCELVCSNCHRIRTQIRLLIS